MSQALERGLDVLEVLAVKGAARVSDVMTSLGVSRATAFRIMVALETRGYVEHLPDSPLWKLGPAVAELAATLDSTFITQIAAPALADLRATSLETVNLALLQRNRMVWAASVPSAHSLRHAVTVGDTVPVHTTAVGKALLTALPRDEWARLLGPEPFPAVTPHSRRTYDAVARDVEDGLRRGWSLDNEESELSGICVAAPIVGRDGRPVAAISVSSVAGRLPDDERDKVGDSVVRWCRQISDELAKMRSQPAS
ncbi:IclR family transcriptional regulator [Lentzea sp. NPDC059081]|uniref:IclR family transcriptional regulator n=1 Tax=Lentzea sp. NPDC059081 TaxID=3346719 RepID=UPI0036CCE298